MIENNQFKNYGFGAEVEFSDQIRPLCLPCTGTCVTAEEIVGPFGRKLLTGKETAEEACAIEGNCLINSNRHLNKGKKLVYLMC